MNNNILNQRDFCYKCNRPQSSCMCKYIDSFETNTKFVILMHPKEHRKTKNGTGKITSLQLKNSEIFVGIDFSNNIKINNYIKNYDCFVLYPDKSAIQLNFTSIKKQKSKKKILLFIIDSTWPCSKRMLKLSKNLNNLQKVSFISEQLSNFKFKTQPEHYCLSTIESTKTILELLNNHNIESIEKSKLDNFLLPFEKMVDYQLSCIEKRNIRYKSNSI
ncbi:DTW domain-containing protein [Malaciobacter molluscorum LMG 25693]|uniref:tRNA-uridine aminocarboxypropyltransferase n=1 Tax=Malaciobacter molluscorum LMG 25693 TaxID=870501 RepID=A0AB33GTF0_9BACT|nr:tRNA-uridine aminocarboxypropyltransferase [Malaciobacter molluscorum]AXX92668.1 DTW domain-containing protein [Malaciobacter molluscorum LMG 25693]